MHTTQRGAGATRYSAVIALTGVLLAGCQDAVVAPPPAGQPSLALSTVSYEASTGPLPAQQMFALVLGIDGEPRAGATIAITVTAEALVSSELAELRVMTPEMEVAQLTAWDHAFRIPMSRTLPSRLRWVGSIEAGQRIQRSFELPVPEAGYFRVTAHVRDISKKPVPLLGGHLAQTASEQERWLFADTLRGRVLERFDTTQTRANYLRVPGPLRTLASSKLVATSDALTTSQLQSGTVIWQFSYFDSQTSQYRPIHSANYSVEYRAGLTGPVTGTDQGYTSLDGYVVIACRPNERYSGLTQTHGSYVRTLPLNTVGWNGQFNSHCGTTQQAILTSDVARVYAIMSQVARDANLSFGYGRPQVLAEVLSGSGGAFYSPSEDRITFRSSSIVGEFGRFVIGHEYGHAYHHNAMGGLNPSYSDNCSPHSLNAPSSYGCALSEGFADFFGTTLTGALLGSFEANLYRPNSSPQPKTEGVVAAAFLDVFDAANETHDNAEWSGSYLPRLVGTCLYQSSGIMLRASGIDHVTYCLEQDVDPFTASLYSSERNIPSSWSHGATLPPTWSKSAARPLWYTNLF